jgi:hypothetical protein
MKRLNIIITIGLLVSAVPAAMYAAAGHQVAFEENAQDTKLMQQFNLEKETITLTHPTLAETERLKNTHYCYASAVDCSTVVFKKIVPKKDSQKQFLSTFALPIIATTAITASILFKYLKKSKE